mmetsp:Transcript_45104/g.111844  ORF Transcript_45104/g.111844 Transcript_45104/m.111844 type:complete len:607 (+) Transcript_45104:76-1896(+)
MAWTPWRLFVLVFVTNLLTNFDSGALPAVLLQLRATPQLTVGNATNAGTAALAEGPPAAPAEGPPAELANASSSPLESAAPAAMADDWSLHKRHAPLTRERALAREERPGRGLGEDETAAELTADECVSGCHGFSLGYFELGVLGSLPYVALSLVSPFVGVVLQRSPVRRVLLLSVVVNGIACLLFGLAPSAWLLQLTRFFVGASQAFAVIYFPVWTDAKAPGASKTLYMSMMQAGVPLGIVVGYLTGGLITSYLDTEHSMVAGWRLPFLLQGALLVPLGLLFATVPEAMLEVSEDAIPLASPGRKRSEQSEKSEKTADRGEHLSGWQMAKELWRSKVYVYVLLCLTSIFFVVSGIQYWVTILLTSYFRMDPGTVVMTFALVSATGPLLGVLAGGWLVDRVGGYSNHVRCLRVLANYTVVGVALAAAICVVESALVVVILIWLLLFVGGAVLAPATGVLLTAVPLRVRAFASAISMMAYNLLGYCLAPLLAGGVIELYGIHWGFRLVVSWVVFSCLFLFLAICAADAAQARAEADAEGADALGDEEGPQLGGFKAYRQEQAKARTVAEMAGTTGARAEALQAGRSYSLVRTKDGSFAVAATEGAAQ